MVTTATAAPFLARTCPRSTEVRFPSAFLCLPTRYCANHICAGGAHNWGKPEDQLKADADALAPAASPAPEDATGAAAPASEPAVPATPEYTLDEFQAMQAAKRVGRGFDEKPTRQVKTEVIGKVYRKDAEAGEGDYFPAVKAAKPVKESAPKQPGAEPKKQTIQLAFKVRDTSIPVSGSGGAAGGGSGRGGRGGYGERSGGASRDDSRPRDSAPRGGSSRLVLCRFAFVLAKT